MDHRGAVFAAALLIFGCLEDTTAEQGAGGSGGSGGGASGGAGGEISGGGGLGGAGGVDAGAGPDGAGGAGPDPGCVDACARLSDCAATVCPGVEGPAAVEADCLAACVAQPAIGTVAGGILECSELVDFGRDRIPSLAESCVDDPGNPPANAECVSYGERVSACLVPACPPAAAHETIFQRAFTHFCDTAIAQGSASPEQIAMLVTDATPCDAPFLTRTVDQLIGAPPDGMGRYCEEGAQLDVATCEAACAAIGPCVPPEDGNASVRNLDRCMHLCLAFPDTIPASSWRCMAQAEPVCETIFECLQPPEVPECANLSARIASCVAEACPPADAVGSALGFFIDPACRGWVQNGEVTREQLASVSDETPCEADFIQRWVTFFTEDDPVESDDGVLVALCAGMTEPSLETCDAACEVVSACIPEGSDGDALREPDVCRFICALTDDAPDEAWACASELSPEMCGAAFACFP
jgi:hypothetical protein